MKGASKPALEEFGPLLCDAPEDGMEKCRHCGLATRRPTREGGALSLVQHREVLLASISAISWGAFVQDGNRDVVVVLVVIV